MSEVRCPVCGGETAYKVFSGGREWDCIDYTGCGMSGEYDDGQAPRRVQMLQSKAGRTALRAEMGQELATRKEQT